MFHPLIWLRGVMLNNRSLTTAICLLLFAALAILFATIIYRTFKHRRPLKIFWKILFTAVIIANIAVCFLFPWPGSILILIVLATDFIPFTTFSIVLFWLIVILSAIIYLAALFFITNPFKIIKPYLKNKIVPLLAAGLFAFVFFDLTSRCFLISFDSTIFSNQHALLPAIRLTSELNNALKVDGHHFQSLKELQQAKPTEITNLKNYGKFCYFYNPDTQTHLIITKFSGHWFVFNHEWSGHQIPPTLPEFSPYVKACQ
jgi:glucan phosphoethanolaminetransferase (alkaline phosphatase superfamily)